MDLNSDDRRQFDNGVEGGSPRQGSSHPGLTEDRQVSAAIAQLPAVVLIPNNDKFLLVHLSIGGRDFIRPGRFHPGIVADFDDELLAHGLSADLIVRQMQILGGAMLFRSEEGSIRISPYSENLGPCDGVRVAEILRENLPGTSIEIVPFKQAS